MRVAMMAVILGVSSGEGMSCQDPDENGISVTWTIPDGPGARGVELLGCHGWGRSLSDDAAQLTPTWTPCSIRAWRRDGLLRVHSTAVRVDGDERALHVAFDLPEGPIGGMGAEVRATGTSVRIEKILDDTPAERAAIPAGSRITAVNGVSTASMSTTRFVRTVTGTPGRPVMLELWEPGASESRRVVLVRERLQR